MKFRVYTIWDNLAKEAGPFFEAKNDDVARRNFKGIIDKNQMREDEYTLFYLGVVDREVPSIEGVERPTVISLNYGETKNEEEPV